MDNKRQLDGVWTGQLVDVRGFKGEITLNLSDDKKGALKGHYRAVIVGQHEPVLGRGEVAGTSARDKLKLTLSSREKDVKMGFDGDLIALRDGGIGMRGSYQLSARGFSPLQTGVVVLSKDRRQESELITRADSREGAR